ncbi:MAG: hypothetical protein ACXAE3_17865, partial [Candidatus Kariarchaeaceae archaeon]
MRLPIENKDDLLDTLRKGPFTPALQCSAELARQDLGDPLIKDKEAHFLLLLDQFHDPVDQAAIKGIYLFWIYFHRDQEKYLKLASEIDELHTEIL